MELIPLYLGVTLAGCFIGSKLRAKKEKLSWLGKAQLVAIIFLLFVLGSRLGANREVLSKLDTIGITAVVLTLLTMAGSIAAAFLARKILKIDKKGNLKSPSEESQESSDIDRGDSK